MLIINVIWYLQELLLHCNLHYININRFLSTHSYKLHCIAAAIFSLNAILNSRKLGFSSLNHLYY